MNKASPVIPFLLCALLGLGGCAWQQAERLASFDRDYARGQYALAASSAEREQKRGWAPGGDSEILWTLNQASALQGAGRWEEAIARFDDTEAHFQRYDLEGEVSRWMRELGAVFTNDAALPYRGTLYDAIMVNTYKALGFMALGDMDNARIELNRAADRQRRAARVYAEQIAEEQRAMAERRDSAGLEFERSLSEANRRMTREYERLEQWAAYPAFVNPLATWLEGLFLMTQAQSAGDFSRAADALERAAGMVPDNEFVAADRTWANELADGRRRHRDLPPTVWVVSEQGMGPVLQEQQIQIPVGFRYQDTPAIWTGIAYPVLQYRPGIAGGLRIEAGEASIGRAPVLSDMDAVISTEFREALPRIVTRAVAASVARTGVQYQLQRNFGDFGGFFGLIFQLYATQADTRIWTALPKTVDMARVERPDDDRVTLTWGGVSRTLELPDSRFVLVWARMPRSGAEPSVEVITLE